MTINKPPWFPGRPHKTPSRSDYVVGSTYGWYDRVYNWTFKDNNGTNEPTGFLCELNQNLHLKRQSNSNNSTLNSTNANVILKDGRAASGSANVGPRSNDPGLSGADNGNGGYGFSVQNVGGYRDNTEYHRGDDESGYDRDPPEYFHGNGNGGQMRPGGPLSSGTSVRFLPARRRQRDRGEQRGNMHESRSHHEYDSRQPINADYHTGSDDAVDDGPNTRDRRHRRGHEEVDGGRNDNNEPIYENHRVDEGKMRNKYVDSRERLEGWDNNDVDNEDSKLGRPTSHFHKHQGEESFERALHIDQHTQRDRDDKYSTDRNDKYSTDRNDKYSTDRNDKYSPEHHDIYNTDPDYVSNSRQSGHGDEESGGHVYRSRDGEVSTAEHAPRRTVSDQRHSSTASRKSRQDSNSGGREVALDSGDVYRRGDAEAEGRDDGGYTTEQLNQDEIAKYGVHALLSDSNPYYKLDIDFCKKRRPGAYGHPNDCNKYIVCFINHKGTEFPCGGGRKWSGNTCVADDHCKPTHRDHVPLASLLSRNKRSDSNIGQKPRRIDIKNQIQKLKVRIRSHEMISGAVEAVLLLISISLCIIVCHRSTRQLKHIHEQAASQLRF